MARGGRGGGEPPPKSATDLSIYAVESPRGRVLSKVFSGFFHEVLIYGPQRRATRADGMGTYLNSPNTPSIRRGEQFRATVRRFLVPAPGFDVG